jgi:hypothetical protein
MPEIDTPISLSDEAMNFILKMTAPLVPDDRTALMAALAQLLRQEPTQPAGDGVVHRHLRALIATGHYRRSDAMAVGGAKEARHSERRSVLWDAEPVRYRGGKRAPPGGGPEAA